MTSMKNAFFWGALRTPRRCAMMSLNMRTPAALPLWKKILFGLVVAVGLLGALELGLRLLLGPPPASTVVYNAIGERERWFQEQGGQVRAVFVDHDPPAPFPAALEGQRCAVLGGSSVHGGSPDLQQAAEFPALLAAELGVPVLNLGAPGLDSFDHVELTRELLAWRFSCLVLYGGHNDFGNMYFMSRYGDASTGAMARVQAGLERLHLYAQLHRAVRAAEWSQSRRPGVPSSTEGFVTPGRLWQALRHLEANTRQLLWMAKKAGVPVLVVLPASDLTQRPTQQFCTGPDCAVDLYQQASQLRQQDPAKAAALLRRARDIDQIPLRAPTAAREVLAAAAAEQGYPVLDAEAALPQERDLQVPSRLLFRDAVHFTAEGHRAMAKIIAPELRALLGQGEGR